MTIVTYGPCCRIALAAAESLARVGIAVEVLDAQTLLLFDTHHAIAASLQKTGRLVILDEDVPGGASAYILQQVLEKQRGYWLLDSPPYLQQHKLLAAHPAAHVHAGAAEA